MSDKKFGPDRFSRFDVYWIQTNRQTNKHQDKPNLYIDKDMYYRIRHVLLFFLWLDKIALKTSVGFETFKLLIYFVPDRPGGAKDNFPDFPGFC